MRATRPAGAARPPRQTDESVRSARLLLACDARGCTQAAREPRDTAERRNAPDATMQTMWCMSVPGSRVLRCAALPLHWNALNASRHGACLRVTLTRTASVPRTHTTCACSCRAGQGTHTHLDGGDQVAQTGGAVGRRRRRRRSVLRRWVGGGGVLVDGCLQALAESARDRPMRCDAMRCDATT